MGSDFALVEALHEPIARRPEPFSHLFVTFFTRNAILETAMVMPRISPVSRANAPGAVKSVIVATHTNRFIHNRLSHRLIVQESALSDFGQRPISSTRQSTA
jgi:hypothetical protein